jgi:hypothetical protein
MPHAPLPPPVGVGSRAIKRRRGRLEWRGGETLELARCTADGGGREGRLRMGEVGAAGALRERGRWRRGISDERGRRLGKWWGTGRVRLGFTSEVPLIYEPGRKAEMGFS